MVIVWCLLLIIVAIGPIEYPMQPSAAALALVSGGIVLFGLAQWVGARCYRLWLEKRAKALVPQADRLNWVVAVASVVGIAGIGLIALDRMVLSGVSNSSYAELLRCAPALIDMIEIQRTPLLYLGYLGFSFGFASPVLFFLKGEQIHGWPAILAQASIVSPVGYALLYSGRMPILFVIMLIAGVVLIRLAKGRPALPKGHHLIVKMTIVVLLFGIYSSVIWSTRQKFCTKMSGLVRELQQKMNAREAEQRLALSERKASSEADKPGSGEGRSQVVHPPRDAAHGKPKPADESISATRLSELAKQAGAPAAGRALDLKTLLATMDQAWHTRPRSYVISAIESGRLSTPGALTILGTYFYLTHGVRVLDDTWQLRDDFSPHWGVYEIGVLSPALRVFFPESGQLASLKAELQSADILGFFPTAWAAAYIDFGAAGAVIYVLLWGFAAGCGSFGARHSALALPALLLSFILASVMLSPVQGPLGIANSALVLVSMIVVGLAADLGGREQKAANTAVAWRPQQAPDAG